MNNKRPTNASRRAAAAILRATPPANSAPVWWIKATKRFQIYAVTIDPDSGTQVIRQLRPDDAIIVLDLPEQHRHAKRLEMTVDSAFPLMLTRKRRNGTASLIAKPDVA